MSKNESKYVQTDIGMIPADWEVKKLATLVEKVGSGVTPKGGEKVYQRQGRPFVRSQNVGWGKFLLHDLYYLPEDIHTKMLSTELKRNDVLLNITGASIGRSAIVDESVEGGNVNQHVCIIRGKKNAIDSYFLNQVLISKIGQTQIDSFQAGGNRQGLNFEQIRSFYIPLPSLPEQRKIATILQTWDKAIAQTQKLIDAKEKLKKGLMQKLLTGEVRFKEFKKEKWYWKEIEPYLIIKATYGIVTAGEFQSTGIKMVRGGDIKRGIVNTQLPMVSHQKNQEYNRTQLEKEDIVISLVGYPGEAAIIPDELIGSNISRAVGLLRVNEKISKKFLVQYLNSEIGRKTFLAPSAGSAQTVVNLSDLNRLNIPMLNFQEQEKIAEVLSCSDSEIHLLEEKLDRLKEQKQGLMQQLLAGKKRVKVA